MKRILLFAVCAVVFTASFAFAAEIAGVQIPEKYELSGKTLSLNGCGIRKKLWIKVYVGSLYSSKKINNAQELLQGKGDYVVKMNILYKKIEAEKLREAYQEGFEKNSPAHVDDKNLKDFADAFNFDVVKGDEIDVVVQNSSKVSVIYNKKLVRVVDSDILAYAVLKVYFGDKPADKNLKKGMLGN